LKAEESSVFIIGYGVCYKSPALRYKGIPRGGPLERVRGKLWGGQEAGLAGSGRAAEVRGQRPGRPPSPSPLVKEKEDCHDLYEIPKGTRPMCGTRGKACLHGNDRRAEVLRIVKENRYGAVIVARRGYMKKSNEGESGGNPDRLGSSFVLIGSPYRFAGVARRRHRPAHWGMDLGVCPRRCIWFSRGALRNTRFGI
jgi:hypothetical protein